MDVEIAAIVGNYDSLAELAVKFDVPYHTVSHVGISREEHEEKIIETVEKYQPDYVILAKYMRILTPNFVAAFENKIINIHHSFLPAFIGAQPYKQAFERGVKIIGATAHYVTNNLDEGPIILQDVIHVDHKYNAEDMARSGKDVEKSVLSKALRLVLEERVFIYENRTVVF